MTKDEALRLALEALESNRRKHHYCEDTWYSCPKHEDGCANDSESDECNCGADKANAEIDQAITAIKAALEAKDEPADNELRRLHDLLGKANALARIRAAEIESLKASLYGHYELEKQYDELKQRLTKTEGQLGEAVWNYGELKREQLANQQKTSGSPVVSELYCICGAEWEWHNRDWELVATSPTAQRQWVGLTDEEIKEMGLDNYQQVVRETENKLKAKNT
jgi:hypothetical protein